MTTYLKQDDVHPVTFKINMDLTGCAGQIILKSRADGTVVVEPVTVTDAAGGVVEWAYDGTLDEGSYKAEIEITRDSEKMTAPSQGYYIINVQCDLNEDD